MTYNKENLRQIFQQPFSMNEWLQMLQHYFHAKELKAEPERIDGTTEDEKGYYLGALDTTDNYRIGLFYYQIQHGNVARKRVGLRNLVKSFINPNWGEFDAALVVFDSGSVWRLSFVCDIKGENTAAKRFTYVFGESDNYYNTPVGRFDALQRNGISFEHIKDAFSVERLNKDFFNGYKERYVKFLNHINDDTKENRDYVKKLLGRLVFLQFLQKKGWMGVPANQQGWNGGDKFYLNHLIESYEGNDRLLSDVLEPLCFNTLNERRDNDLADSRLGENIKIPYLNGGLFDKDDLDKKDIDFPYDYFKELMDFFAMYNFTIDENDPEDSEIGIDPEMLGHIFENLLEDNKDKGAFYTPKEIVQYMSQESVVQYLKSHAPEELHTAIDSLIKQRVVEPILQNKENARLVNKALSVVKVCDPAIGSGAFPMGVLNVLFDCRHLLYGFIGKNEDFSYAKVKRDIIQNNIYGVDIEKGAVDIARLRFWLALVVDENEPQPLPNLDYKIMCGDSLLHRFALDAPFQNILRDYNQKNHTNYTLEDYRQWVYDYTDISDHTKKDDFRQRIEDIKRAVKTELSDKEKGKIAKVRGAIDNLQIEDMFGGKKNEKKIKALQKELKALEQQRTEIESNKIYDQAFEWRFEFPALLDENGDFMGFDIVIGNPPYVNIANIKPDSYRKQLQSLFYSNRNKSDLYAFFIEKGFDLLNKDGVQCYIVPHTWKATDSFKNLREIIFKHHSLVQIVNQKMGVFDAVVNPMIILLKNVFNENYNIDVFDGIGKFKYTINVQEIKTDPNLSIDSESTLEEKILFKSIERCKYRLSDVISFSRGIKTSDDKRFISTECVNSEYKKVYRGRNIKAYSMNWAHEYIWYRPDLMREKVGCLPHSKEYFEVPEKLITQRVNSSMQLLVTYDNKQNYFLDTTNVSNYKTWNKHFSLKYICGVLNSKVVNYWYPHKYRMPTIGGYELSSIPIPEASQRQQQEIIDLVDCILSMKEIDSMTDTSSLEAGINRYVYHLYGLTFDEVLIIDPETPITREEYGQYNVENR